MTQPETDNGTDPALIERRLEAIDVALAEGRATAGDPDELALQELALELTALAPAAAAGFTNELDERVERGFAPDAGADSPRTPVRPWRSLGHLLPRRPLPALGVAASALVALAVTVALIDGGGQSTTRNAAPSQARGASQDESLQQAPLASPSARSGAPSGGRSDSTVIAPAPPVPPTDSGGLAPKERQRRVERSATLTLSAADRKLDDVARQVVQVTERHRGFVLSSSVSTGNDSSAGGSFDLRVPVDQLQATLTDLGHVAKVRSESQSGEDRTQAFVSAEDRLRSAKAERKSLLNRLAGADSDRQAQALRQRLEIVASEINSLRGQLRDLRERTAYAAIRVQLERSGSSSATGGSGDGMSGALDDAGDTLEDALGIAIRAIAVAIPLAIVAALAWLAVRTVRRRRREATLGD